MPLGGRYGLGVGRLRSTAASRSATTAAGWPRESAPSAALAAGPAAIVSSTTTTGHPASAGIVVASSVCIRLGSSLLDDDALPVDRVRVRSDRRVIARLIGKFDECAVLIGC